MLKVFAFFRFLPKIRFMYINIYKKYYLVFQIYFKSLVIYIFQFLAVFVFENRISYFTLSLCLNYIEKIKCFKNVLRVKLNLKLIVSLFYHIV